MQAWELAFGGFSRLCSCPMIMKARNRLQSSIIVSRMAPNCDFGSYWRLRRADGRDGRTKGRLITLIFDFASFLFSWLFFGLSKHSTYRIASVRLFFFVSHVIWTAYGNWNSIPDMKSCNHWNLFLSKGTFLALPYLSPFFFFFPSIPFPFPSKAPEAEPCGYSAVLFLSFLLTESAQHLQMLWMSGWMDRRK